MMSGAVWVRDRLQSAGWRVEVADARKVKGLAPLTCKTDKVDARVLAEVVPPRFCACGVAVVAGRRGRCASDSSGRMHLVGMRTMARNRIHVGTGPARAGRRTTLPPKRDQLEFTQIGLLRGDQLRRKAAAVLAAT
jgi:hypothetical protein